MIARRTPIARSTKPIARHTSVRKSNPERKRRLFEEDFGDEEYVKYLHSLSCAVCEANCEWTVAGHTKSRGAGGKVDDLAPLCASRFLGTATAVEGCHEKYDRRDPEVRQHEMRLRSLAKKLRADWLAGREARESCE
jgi:hypothetical protein